MAQVTYSKSSPYFTTSQSKNYLDVMSIRDIAAQADDTLFILTSQYKHRPDLLAFDLYQDPGLWWVFAMRNKDTIRDPIYDMIPGIKLYLPKAQQLRRVLGI
jgi:hypothetical protein